MRLPAPQQAGYRNYRAAWLLLPGLEIMKPVARPKVRPKSSAIISAYVALATVAIGILALDFSPPPRAASPDLTVHAATVKAATLEISAFVAGALASH
jgi:hypothetical protein